MNYAREILIKSGVPDNDDAMVLKDLAYEALHAIQEYGSSHTRDLLHAIVQAYKLGLTLKDRPEYGGWGDVKH